MRFLELLKIEFMKVKRSKIVPLIFIAPLLVVASGVASLSRYSTPEYTNAWPAMFIQSALVYAYYLLPFSMIDIKENSSFIDVGTGAGFPSIPLMIVRPDLKGTLLEALNKRCVFLEKACELTGVDAKVVHGRAEDYAKEKREAFDFATARAVAAMPVLCEYCIPYVKTGGRFIALKSVNEDETQCEKAVKVLGGKIAQIKDYTITNGDNRRLFIIDKVSQTPTKYPRNPSMIKKKPL